jgi:arylsulfatase A-like enzyme
VTVEVEDMSDEDIRRGVLPIPDRRQVGLTTYEATDPDTAYPPIRPLRPPAGAPNVLVVLLDDVGFGAASAFGGPCNTPTAERLAAGGLKYTRFHTTALCSPSRAALLSGRNHHAVGMGGITEIATSAPGYNSLRPNTCAPLAEIMKLNGYSTAQVGKCHEVPVFESSPIGPFDHWPHPGGGFEQETFARQQQLGVIPPECELTARPGEIPAWDEQPEKLKPVLAREMEVYAAFLEYADHHVGRVIDAVADLGVLEDTLVYYIIGDNGASAEGGLIGTTNETMGGEAVRRPTW